MKKKLIKWIVPGVIAAALIAGAIWFFTTQPLVSTPMGTAKIDHRIDTSAVTALVVDEGDVLSEKTEKIIALYNANWRALTGQSLAVVTVKSTDHAAETAQQWLERMEPDGEMSLLLLETGGNLERVLLTQGALEASVADQPAGMLDSLTMFLMKDGDFDGAALAVFERVHRFVSTEDPTAVMNDVMVLLSIAASIPVLLVVLFVLDKLDTNRVRHWYLSYGMTEPPLKPWRPIFPWHKKDSSWFDSCLRDFELDNNPNTTSIPRRKRNPHRISMTAGMMMRRR